MFTFNFHPFPTLSTDRLILRPFQETDVQGVFEMRSSPHNNLYIDRPNAETQQDAKDFIAKIEKGVNENKWINWGIETKKDGEFIGLVCLWNLSLDKMQGELGYEIHFNFQRNGYVQEAIKKAIEYGFKKMNLQIIEAATHEKNIASIKVLEKNNFQNQGNLDGESAHFILYVLSRENYLAKINSL